MGKIFEILNRINHILTPNQGSKYTRDSGMNAKIKTGENVVVKLG
jgi:hypothetical protein|tara:strand:+ start:10136 stop:10270 length:135 start_codon:yes stop_codon:yes gene_type:complete